MRCRNLLLLAGLGLCPTMSYALACSVTNVQSINFGTVNPLSTSSSSTSMTFGYSCTRGVLDGLLTAVTLCFNIGASSNSGQVTTRTMANTLTSSNTLSYQLYQGTSSGTVWGSQFVAGTTPAMVNLSSLVVGVPSTGSLTVAAVLPLPQISAIPGSFQDIYSSATAIVTSNTGLLVPPGSCGTTVATTFAFNVLATVAKQCTVTPNGNISMGAVNSTATNTTSSNTLSVACSNGTAYTVGLVPSNSSTTGSGVMVTSPSNGDQVPYQLSSTAGPNGTVWGSASTNQVAGTGNGSATSYTVYATVPSANYTPGNYADTVTVNVTY
jgi:spore coat protein U-like protein